MNKNGICPPYVVIEGNIGAGKSTFVSLIKRYLDVHVVYEPHEQWQSVGSSAENILEKFYTDMPRWAYTFQSYAFVTRVRAQQQAAQQFPHLTQIVERSVYSDRYCFAKNCFELGYMNALEWKLYQEWFSWLVDNYTQRPHGFIYLRTTPDVCHERLKKRDRKEEVGVGLDYLQSLHDKHERWLIDKEGVAPSLSDVPALVLDANQEFEGNRHLQQEWVQQIKDFMGETPYCVPLGSTEQVLGL